MYVCTYCTRNVPSHEEQGLALTKYVVCGNVHLQLYTCPQKSKVTHKTHTPTAPLDNSLHLPQPAFRSWTSWLASPAQQLCLHLPQTGCCAWQPEYAQGFPDAALSSMTERRKQSNRLKCYIAKHSPHTYSMYVRIGVSMHSLSCCCTCTLVGNSWLSNVGLSDSAFSTNTIMAEANVIQYTNSLFANNGFVNSICEMHNTKHAAILSLGLLSLFYWLA